MTGANPFAARPTRGDEWIPKDKITNLRNRVTATAKQLREDKRYTEEGRRNAIAAAYLDAVAQARELHQQYATEARAKRPKLERELFGIPSSGDPTALLSWRDAQDRADRIEGEKDGIRMFERAVQSGDTHLAKAVLARAVRSDWTPILEQADTILPGSTDKLAELAALPTESLIKLQGISVFRIFPPSETNGVDEETLGQWAADAPPVLPPETTGPSLGVGALPRTDTADSSWVIA
ncbi:hypothetical protein OG563_06010 [Nocardia vinacea]|uniref:Uncharacterized protein n=1 Tax=Nocardia vinacea TaxID=96468 RepID=A0ABZ1YX30_9NOCA|nr:hypothetical protein [Nocardia vinacea]